MMERNKWTDLGKWTKSTLDNEYVFQFEPSEKIDPEQELGGRHPYAPLQFAGSAGNEDAFYVRVEKNLKDIFKTKAISFSDDPKLEYFQENPVYVSLRYLQDLALNKLAWNPMEVLDLEQAERDEERKIDDRVGDLKAQLSNLNKKKVNKKKTENKKKKGKKEETDDPDTVRANLINVLVAHRSTPPTEATVPHNVDTVAPSFNFINAYNGTDRKKVPQGPQVPQPNQRNDVTGNQRALDECLGAFHTLQHNEKKHYLGKSNRICTDYQNCDRFKEAIKGVFPFRNHQGRLLFGFYVRPGDEYRYYHSYMRRFWMDYWGDADQRLQFKAVRKSSGWRVRHDSTPLSRPLVIWLLPGAQNRFPKAREVFERIISKVNDGDRKKNRSLQLELASRHWKPYGNYFLLSEDPFRLYQTYIHKYCVHEYMNAFKVNVAVTAKNEQTDINGAHQLPQDNGAMIDETQNKAQSTAVPLQNDDKMILESDTTVKKEYDPIRSFPVDFDDNPPPTDTNADTIMNMAEDMTADTTEDITAGTTTNAATDATTDGTTDRTYSGLQKRIATYWPKDVNTVIDRKAGDNDEDDEEDTYDDEDDAIRAEPEGGIGGQDEDEGEEDEEDDMDISSDEDEEPMSVDTDTTGQNANATANKPKDMTRSVHVNPINARKVIRAAGSRKSQKSQKEVMGFSASFFADDVLGWSWHEDKESKRKKRQMANGLYIAEWLHMSAYSWGGIRGGSDAAARSSSQTKENLVFGTSEANSCMTRYEKAWQQLFKDEKLLLDAELAYDKKNKRNQQNSIITEETNKEEANNTEITELDDLQGELSVVINTKEGPYLADEYDSETGRYTWKKKRCLDEKYSLAKLAQEFPFLAYNIRYEIRLAGQSSILTPASNLAPTGKKNGAAKKEPPTILSMKVMFYPFSRRFYHRSEYLLDMALYQHMFMSGAIKRFEHKPGLAEKVIVARFDKNKYAEFLSNWRKPKTDEVREQKLNKAREELEAMMKIPVNKEKDEEKKKKIEQSVQDAKIRYGQAKREKVNQMKDYRSKAGYTIKWPLGNEGVEVPKDHNKGTSINVSELRVVEGGNGTKQYPIQREANGANGANGTN